MKEFETKYRQFDRLADDLADLAQAAGHAGGLLMRICFGLHIATKRNGERSEP